MTAFRLKDVLDRVFEGDDVLAALEIHRLDERGERGRLAAADRAGNEDETVMETGQQFEALGQAELIHRADVSADDAKDDVDPKTLPNDAGAETPEIVGVGEIDVATLLELCALRLGQETRRQRRRFLGGQLWRLRPDGLEISVETPERLRVDAEMDVGGAALLSDGKILINVRDGG